MMGARKNYTNSLLYLRGEKEIKYDIDRFKKDNPDVKQQDLFEAFDKANKREAERR